MIEKADLIPVFQAWYDHKMEPADADLARQHRQTIDALRMKMEELNGGQPLDAGDVRRALWPRFGQWMIEEDLPPPPKG
jgi:hypothetical protein